MKAVNDKLTEYYNAGGIDMGSALSNTQINAIASYVEKAVKEKDDFSAVDLEEVAAQSIIGLAKKGFDAKNILEADRKNIEEKILDALPSSVDLSTDEKKKAFVEGAYKAAGSVERAGTPMRVGASLVGIIAGFIGFKWLFGSKE